MTVVQDAFVYRFAVDFVQTALIYEQWHVALLEVLCGFAERFERPVGYSDVEGFALAHHVDQCLKGLFDRGVGVEAVRVEQVYVVEAHPFQALVETGNKIFARAKVAVGACPHTVAGLGADEQLVAIGAEVVVHELAQGLFCRSGRGTVVVCEVEVGYAVVEGIAGYGAATLEGVAAAEVVPHS